MGTLIYLLFRVSTLKIFNWLNIFKIDFIKSDFRNWILSNSSIFPKWFLFSLPDGLWTFSYVSAMLCIWDFKLNNRNFIWITFIPLVAVVSEIGQKIKIVPGTFDKLDLLFYVIGFIAPIIFSIKTIDFKNYNL